MYLWIHINSYTHTHTLAYSNNHIAIANGVLYFSLLIHRNSYEFGYDAVTIDGPQLWNRYVSFCHQSTANAFNSSSFLLLIYFISCIRINFTNMERWSISLSYIICTFVGVHCCKSGKLCSLLFESAVHLCCVNVFHMCVLVWYEQSYLETQQQQQQHWGNFFCIR